MATEGQNIEVWMTQMMEAISVGSGEFDFDGGHSGAIDVDHDDPDRSPRQHRDTQAKTCVGWGGAVWSTWGTMRGEGEESGGDAGAPGGADNPSAWLGRALDEGGEICDGQWRWWWRRGGRSNCGIVVHDITSWIANWSDQLRFYFLPDFTGIICGSWLRQWNENDGKMEMGPYRSSLDGSWRLCLDFQDLNKMTVNEKRTDNDDGESTWEDADSRRRSWRHIRSWSLMTST